MKTIRIFISSPGDVQEERERARGVVHQLRRRYAGKLDLQAVLWEELPLQADMSFQQGIDVVLSEHGVDIAVFILWSRLGSPLGPIVAGEDGRNYRSGTEREWNLMLRARQRCQNEDSPARPAIIVYTRKDEVSFEERLRGKPDDEKAIEIDQKRLVHQFIEEEFRDTETGANIRAYHSFDQPTTFAQQLRVHLTGLLDPLAGENLSSSVWDIAEQGPPFRGLGVFEFEHNPIFFGREDETVTIRTRLRLQARNGCAFMLVCGPSGSGKSSLARAGVIPDICNFEIDDDVRQWRRLVVKPSSLGNNLLQGLIHSLTADTVLPELKQWQSDITAPADHSQFSSWLTRFQLRVMDALKSAGGKKQSTRLVLLVDQLEELFSDTSIDNSTCDDFFMVLESLARCGKIWILATARSDFYQQMQAIPALVRMKEGGGHFDLLPPTPDALARVITGPATLAGLTFERQGDRVLSDAILAEAADHKELLPLVEHLLSELYKRRSTDGTLTFSDFTQLGGVEGALRRCCEDAYAGLSAGARSSLEEVLSELVTLRGESNETSVRRMVPLEQIATTQGRRELIDAMIKARLFTATTGADGSSMVTIAHESLLRVWPRVTEWINRNREFLRLRAAVEHSLSRWKSSGRDRSLLLPSGLALEEGRRLLEIGSTHLSPPLVDYIAESISDSESNLAKTTRRRRAVIASLATTTAILAVLGIYAWRQSYIARSALDAVEKQAEVLEERNKRIADQVEDLNTANTQLITEINKKNRALNSANLAASGLVSELVAGTRNWADIGVEFRSRLLIRAQNVLLGALVASEEANPEIRRQLGIVYSEMAINANEAGNVDKAQIVIDSAKSVFKKLYDEQPNETNLSDLLIALRRHGEILMAADKYDEAITILQEGLKISDDSNLENRSDDEFHTRLGLAYSAIGKLDLAEEHIRLAHEVIVSLAEQDDSLQMKKKLAGSNLNMGIRIMESDSGKALEYLQAAVQIGEEYEEGFGKNKDIEVMNVKLQAFSSASDIYTESNNYESAIKFRSLAVVAAKLILDAKKTADAADDLARQLVLHATIHDLDGNKTSAIESIDSAIHLYEQIVAREDSLFFKKGLALALLLKAKVSGDSILVERADGLLGELVKAGLLSDQTRNDLLQSVRPDHDGIDKQQ